ncbi:MAG: hypothetical protein IJ661_08425 [Lachnospiraceae bacterium]|nr:hypothetical protein [Lachnospiraceae bacterium]
MKNALRLYITFIPTRVLPWLVLVVYPIVITLLSITSGGYLWTEFLVMPFVYMVELLLALIMFRELESKEPVRIEYIHSSAKGMHAFGSVMMADIIRRFITALIIFMTPAVWYGGLHMGGSGRITLEIDGETAIENVSPLCNMLVIFALLSVIELVGYLIKRIRSGALVLTAAIIGYIILTAFGFTPFGIPGKLLPAAVVVAALIYLLIVILIYKAVMKHEKEKYYDSQG